MMNLDQFWIEIKRVVRGIVYDVLESENVYNSQMWMDGKVNAIASDAKHADCYLNAASTVTASIPIAPHVGTLAVNDQVLVLRRAPRDYIIMSKKVM